MPNKLTSPLLIILLGLTLTQTAGCTQQQDDSVVAQSLPQATPQI